MRILCLDFGNTVWKGALFSTEGALERSFLITPKDAYEELSYILARYTPTKTILSSVVHHNPAIDSLLSARTQFRRASERLPDYLRMPKVYYGKMGEDRLALAAAACTLLPAATSRLIISAGTCITYNFINSEGVFLGGAISAGMKMRLDAMGEKACLLPKCDLRELLDGSAPPLVAYDTPTHLASGLAWGVVKEIEGVIDLYKNTFERLVCVLTGGDLFYIEKLFNTPITTDAFFLFKGLYALAKDS